MSGDENSQRDMNAFIAGLDQIKREFECSILIIHHTGYSNTERERGSSVLRAGVDTSMMLKRSSEDYTADLRVLKQKDDNVQRVVRFRGSKITTDDGATTLVFEPEEVETKQYDKKPLTFQQSQIKRTIVHLMLDYGEFKEGAITLMLALMS